MRILELRFKNLNSLVGEWKVDLRHSDFVSDGIFAITGPTGAGKTTVLDAICLALYARTPRLNKVTKGINEIMSRHTDECFAEVTFETRVGRYRCHWSQRRASKKRLGNLQPPKHEIADADTGDIFGATIQHVASKVEETTGMNFERFTRSMLLAQGDFAAFLQADPDDRAPLLEQITGTEIYSNISIKVHERRFDERKKLEVLQADLAGIELLSSDEEQQFKDVLKQKTSQELEFNQEVTKNKQGITWLSGIIQLEDDLKQLGKEKEELQIQVDAFAPDQEKLKQAMRVLEVAGEYTELKLIRCKQEADLLNHCQYQAGIPILEETVKFAEEAMKAAANSLDANKLEQQKAVIVIRNVRELDLRIREKDTQIKDSSDAILAHEKSHEMLCLKQNKDCIELNSKRQSIEVLKKELDDTKVDEGLLENLTGLSSRIDTLRGIDVQYRVKLDEVRHADAQVCDSILLFTEQIKNLESQRYNLKAIQDLLAQKQSELKCILEDREISDWREDLESLTKQQTILNNLSDAVFSIIESKRVLDEQAKRKEFLLADRSTLMGQLHAQVEKQTSIDKEIDLLEIQFSLLKKIENFEEARHQLKDGELCPLCGAEEHPFAKGNIPAPDETKERLMKARADLKIVTGEILDLKVKQAEVSKDLEQVACINKQHDERIEKSKSLIMQTCASFALNADDPELSEKLESLKSKNAVMRDCAIKIIKAADGLERELTKLHESLEKAKDIVVKAELENQAAEHKKTSSEVLLERLKNDAEAIQLEVDKSFSLLQKEVDSYGVQSISIRDLDQVQAQLIARRDQWVSRQKAKAELDRDIATLDIQIRHQSEQIQKSDEEIRKQKTLRDTLLLDRETFSCKRCEIFGDKHPDDEEFRLTLCITIADKELEIARQKFNAEIQELGKLKSRIEELEKAIKVCAPKLKSFEERFCIRLKELEIADEYSFKAACLTEDERKILSKQSQRLANDSVALASREGDKTKLLEAERKKQTTNRSLDELNSDLTILLASQKELQQAIGAICQKLKENESLKQKHQERSILVDAHKRECLRWDLLHELIGSADGKKYRNFAQGLTFEMMIRYANRQLQKMTDRYLLIRNNDRPLELDVIDNYQAGDIRSTKNLSGGESFIVSLALALGLSQMASKNLRVDSLFLDEGFGTLDDEALDMALETLAGLKQDGKLIGVISHVAAIKERISTQIQVIPKTGGRSRLFGPGCACVLVS